MLERPISKQAVVRDAAYLNGHDQPNLTAKARQVPQFIKTEAPELPEIDLPTEFTTFEVGNSNSDSNGSSNEETLEELLHFDPFTMNYSNQLMATDFGADGSLGLVPFLNENADEYRDDDQMSDRIGEEGGAVSFGW